MLKYSCPKGKRVKTRYFCGVMIDFDSPNRGSQHYSWASKDKKWITYEEYEGMIPQTRSSHCPCNSVRQFRRMLKKWAEYMPSGTKFMLVNRYECWSVIGII
jgi:hypothetical protein